MAVFLLQKEVPIMYTSTRSKNAIRIVIDMMRHREGCRVAEIAQRQELSVIYTRNLLIPLVKSTLIKKSRRGFQLAKTTDQFTLADIIRAVV